MEDIRRSFTFRPEWWDMVRDLRADVRGDVLTAVIEYGVTGSTNGRTKRVGTMIADTIRRMMDAETVRNGAGNSTDRDVQYPNRPDAQSTDGKKENKKNKESSPLQPPIKKEKEEKKEEITPLPLSFEPIVEEWMAYKRERGQTYKPKGYAQMVRQLLKLSNGDPMKAREIVEQSMANNWAGLFPIKQTYNYGNSRRNTSPTELADAIARGFALGSTPQQW